MSDIYWEEKQQAKFDHDLARDEARRLDNAERDRVRHDQRKEIEEIRSEARAIQTQLEQEWEPEKLQLLLEDFIQRLGLQLQFNEKDLAIRRQDLSQRNDIDLLYQEGMMLIRVREHAYKTLITLVLNYLLGDRQGDNAALQRQIEQAALAAKHQALQALSDSAP